jgi:hypothetical protein
MWKLNTMRPSPVRVAKDRSYSTPDLLGRHVPETFPAGVDVRRTNEGVEHLIFFIPKPDWGIRTLSVVRQWQEASVSFDLGPYLIPPSVETHRERSAINTTRIDEDLQLMSWTPKLMEMGL